MEIRAILPMNIQMDQEIGLLIHRLDGKGTREGIPGNSLVFGNGL
jgi:hypothetical protein